MQKEKYMKKVMEREKKKNVNQVEKEGRTKERKVEEKNAHQKSW